MSAAKKDLLMDLFLVVVKKQKVKISVALIKQLVAELVRKGLKFDYTLTRHHEKTLANLLRYLIKKWPGFPAMPEDDLTALTAFEKFEKHVHGKFRCAINEMKGFRVAYEKDTKNVETNCFSTQTESTLDQAAPTQIDITAPISQLNGLYFQNIDGEVSARFDKKIQQISIDSLTLAALLNWPSVSMSVKLPEIEFTRINEHTNKKIVSNKNISPPDETTEKIAAVAPLSDNDDAVVVYNYAFISSYLRQLISLMRKHNIVAEQHLNDFELMSKALLDDIDYVDINNKTVPTNVQVTYNLVKFKYIRSTKCDSQGNAPIYFIELEQPRTKFWINKFSPMQDLSKPYGSNSFVQLNQLQAYLDNKDAMVSNEDLEQILLKYRSVDVISYRCTLCNMACVSSYAITEHILEHHRELHEIFCYTCKKKFNKLELAKTKWMHLCVEPEKSSIADEFSLLVMQ